MQCVIFVCHIPADFSLPLKSEIASFYVMPIILLKSPKNFVQRGNIELEYVQVYSMADVCKGSRKKLFFSGKATKATFSGGILFRASKKFFFLSDQACNPPPS